MSRNYPQAVLKSIFDLIFPSRCIGCGKLSQKSGQYVCSKCLNSIGVRGSFECIGCKKPTPKGMTCETCRPDNPINRLFIAADYKNPLVEKMIKLLKYKFIVSVADQLADLSQKYIRHCARQKNFSIFESNPVIIPVPLHYRRYNWRGFNQAELIGKNIADAFQMEFLPEALIKTKTTKPQADIEGRYERLSNTAGSFRFAGGNIAGRNILLIDDVCTTGATLNECARVLKAAGALWVAGFVIARG